MSAVMHAGMRRPAANNRAIHYAVLGSLLFHAVFLFAFSMQRASKSPAAAPSPLVAHLAQPPKPPASQPAPKPEPEPPKPRVEEPPPPPRPRPVKPVAKPTPLPAPRASQPVPPPPPAPSAPTPPVEAQAAPSAPAPMARIEPLPTPPAQSAPDAGTLDTYRLELMRIARKYKRYPRVAMDNNWEGRVVVRMVVGANGIISSLSIATSTGHEVLDKQALDMIQKAKGGVQIPPALRGKEFTLEIPVIYSLKDQDSG
jgi:protein TonB